MTDVLPLPPRLLAQTPSMRVRSVREMIPEAREQERDSTRAVRTCIATLKADDSSAKDKWSAVRLLLFLTFEDPQSSRVAYVLAIFLFLSIIVNCLSFVAGSVRSAQVTPETCLNPACIPPGTEGGALCEKMICPPVESPALWYIEFWTIIIFSVDYLIRVGCVHAVPRELVSPRALNFTVDGKLKDRAGRPEQGPVGKTIKYMLSWLQVVDVVSIVPFYVAMSIKDSKLSKDLGVMRVLRLLRVARIFKLGKYSEGGMIIGRTLRASLPALVLFVFLTTILTIIFGSFMYFFEGGHFTVTQAFPSGAFLRDNARGTAKELTPFTNILVGMYWVVVNTTTLGNAALYPTTVFGRICSCFVAYCGILSLALPISIVGKNFTEQYNMCYDKIGGNYDTHPLETAEYNHDVMMLNKQQKEDEAKLQDLLLRREQRLQQDAAAAGELGISSTLVKPPKTLGDSTEAPSFLTLSSSSSSFLSSTALPLPAGVSSAPAGSSSSSNNAANNDSVNSNSTTSSSNSSSRPSSGTPEVGELLARLMRMEQEMEALKAQLRVVHESQQSQQQ